MIQFGTGGWRALIGETFTRENVQRLTMGLGSLLLEESAANKRIVIGYDRRFLSAQASVWMAQVLAAMDIQCLLLDREAPTPVIMFAVGQYGLDWGAAVTASHNPALYNGIKIFTKGGRDADQDTTRKIEQYIQHQQKEPVPVMHFETGISNGHIQIIDPTNPYLDSILSQINVAAIRKKHFRIVVDPMFGVGASALQTALFTARAQADLIHERRDAHFGGRLPAPSEQTLLSLQNMVLEKAYDLGLATDGDADRLGIIDDKGRYVHPNEILSMLYYYLMAYKKWKGAVVRNLATTHMLDRIAHAFGEKCYEVPVGFKHISSKMEDTNAILGGESSGGLTVRGHILGKDGVYAAMLMVELMAVTGKCLSEFSAELNEKFGCFVMLEREYRFTDTQKAALEHRLFTQKKLPDFEESVASVSYLDGCKVVFRDGGWIICRFSGTEPLLRIFCERSTAQAAAHTITLWEQDLDISCCV